MCRQVTAAIVQVMSALARAFDAVISGLPFTLGLTRVELQVARGPYYRKQHAARLHVLLEDLGEPARQKSVAVSPPVAHLSKKTLGACGLRLAPVLTIAGLDFELRGENVGELGSVAISASNHLPGPWFRAALTRLALARRTLQEVSS